MNLATLPKTTEKPYRRIGRGHGSGRVKTSGRGTKGQKARENIGLRFAGSSLQASWIKRLPLLRGKGKNKGYREKVTAVNVKYLSLFKANSDVNMATLKTMKIIGEGVTRAKVLGNAPLKIALNVQIPASSGAKKIIEKAGGKVTEKVILDSTK